MNKNYKLTITGTNGGFTRRRRRSSQAICRKNDCFLTSSASLSLLPSLRSGFLRNNCQKNLSYKFLISYLIPKFIF